jgi:hypothetical protein
MLQLAAQESSSSLSSSSSPSVVTPAAEPPQRTWLDVLRSGINPPMIGTLIGLLMGFVPSLRDLFVNKTGDAIFQNTIWNSIKLYAIYTFNFARLSFLLLDSHR